MDLKKLNLADLATLRAGIDMVSRAGQVFADAGLDPVFSLTERETLLSAGPILGEPDIDGAVIEEPDVPERPLGGRAVAPALADPLPEARALRTGAFSDNERAKILHLHDAGASAKQIAETLSRKPGAVAMMVGQLVKQRGKQKEIGGALGSRASVTPPGQTRAQAGPAASRTAPADECIGSPQGVSNGATEKRGPGGKGFQTSETTQEPQSADVDAGPRKLASPMGHPTASSGAEAAPAADGSPPPAIPSQGADSYHPNLECPPDFRGLKREVWGAVAALRASPWFDAELDLELTEGLLRGQKLAELALDYGLDAEKLKARFGALTATIRNERGQVELDGQAALLEVLRTRVKRQRGVIA
ncbi:helix-turn-helix domain-containing protein [Cereibacter sphaeroides]|nr:helix-turn-helix domain-containing protein [Cereibacter sphaeroides]